MDKIQLLIPAILVLNILLSAVAQAFDVLHKSEKLPQWVKDASGLCKKILDIVSANNPH